MSSYLVPSLALTAFLFFSYCFGKNRALAIARARQAGDLEMGTAVNRRAKSHRLQSQPNYHAAALFLQIFIPLLLFFVLWSAVEPVMLRELTLGQAGVDQVLSSQGSGSSSQARALFFSKVKNSARGVFGLSHSDELVEHLAHRYLRYSAQSTKLFWILLSLIAIGAFICGSVRIQAEFEARERVEGVLRGTFYLCALFAIAITVGIICSLIFESVRFFKMVPISEFLFGTKWSPQMALRADQVGSTGAFGALPLFAGTFLIASIAMAVAVPIGLFSAIYLSEYAGPRVRALAKPMLEILAGIPTVVYGFFAALTVAPFIRDVGQMLHLSVSSESALAAGGVMGVMIIPFVSSLSDDVINAVPQSLRDGSLALGATQSETVVRVILPAALPGIVGAVLLALSRAIGETMIVVMAAGLAANLTLNPLENVTTVTVQIVGILVGDQEFESAKTLSAFALGLVLFCVTLVFNVIALQVVKRYREVYD